MWEAPCAASPAAVFCPNGAAYSSPGLRRQELPWVRVREYPQPQRGLRPADTDRTDRTDGKRIPPCVGGRHRRSRPRCQCPLSPGGSHARPSHRPRQEGNQLPLRLSTATSLRSLRSASCCLLRELTSRVRGQTNDSLVLAVPGTKEARLPSCSRRMVAAVLSMAPLYHPPPTAGNGRNCDGRAVPFSCFRPTSGGGGEAGERHSVGSPSSLRRDEPGGGDPSWNQARMKQPCSDGAGQGGISARNRGSARIIEPCQPTWVS